MGKLIEIPRASDPYEQLNPEQRRAVTHGRGPLLVVAGAGTGKTRVIIERIRYLLESNPELSGENILGLTFTDKAAAEMKERVMSAVGERGAGVWLGTFHGFCQSLLAELQPDLKVLEEVDHWILLRRNMAQLGLRHYKRLAEPGRFLSDFVKFFARCQDELVTPAEYEAHVAAARAALEREQAALDPETQDERREEVERQEEVARAYRASDELARPRRLYPFGALLLDAVRELRANPELLRYLRARYHHIVVDEFQDTNVAQIELLALLAGDRRNILAVGDDDQAIYRFRGASFGSFKLFAERFLGRPFAPGDAEAPVVKLVRNYRSTKRILRVAGQTIAQNADRIFRDKQLVTTHAEGDRVQVVECGSAEEEAHWIAAELERRHERGDPWSAFAVLYRAHHHRDALVEALVRRGIPFVIKNLSILGNPLVRDLIAHLRLVVTASDDVACARVLAAPAWGLEPGDVVRLAERARARREPSLWKALETAQGEPGFAGGAHRTAELIRWMKSLRDRARVLPASALVDALIGDLVAGLGVVGLPTAADRRALERFRKFVADWEAKGETQELREFVEYLEYFREAGAAITLEEEARENALQLMTVHAAKGLEFDQVFVIRLSRRQFPVNPRKRVLEFPPELMKEALPVGDSHVQEERRLFYVALTRARKRLTLTAVVNKQAKVSPFVEDVLLEPKVKRQDVQQLAPKVALPAAGPAAAARRQLFAPQDLDARAYSRVAGWAATYHPPVSAPLLLSASAVETYQQCPQKYLLRQMWSLRGGPRAALTFGDVMHKTIRQLVESVKKKRRMPFEEVAQIFHREWSAGGFQDAYQEEAYKKAGLEQLEAFHRSYTAEPADVLHQERAFELPLADDVIVTGRMDQINRLGPREVEIVDYKTGRPREQQDAKKSLQLSMYALAARDVLELEPVRLTFFNLTTNERVSVVHSEKELARARAAVEEAAASIRAGEFPARPTQQCRHCDYTLVCPAHEQPVTLAPAR